MLHFFIFLFPGSDNHVVVLVVYLQYHCLLQKHLFIVWILFAMILEIDLIGDIIICYVHSTYRHLKSDPAVYGNTFDMKTLIVLPG